MSILFINGSPNHHGNTASLAAALLKGKEYETLNLTDYTIGAYGQQLPGDGLDTVIAAMEKARHHRHRFAAVLAQHLRQRPQCAGSLLRPRAERRAVRAKAVFRVPGCCAGKVDAGGGRIHHEALRRAVRHEL